MLIIFRFIRVIILSLLWAGSATFLVVALNANPGVQKPDVILYLFLSIFSYMTAIMGALTINSILGSQMNRFFALLISVMMGIGIFFLTQSASVEVYEFFIQGTDGTINVNYIDIIPAHLK